MNSAEGIETHREPYETFLYPDLRGKLLHSWGRWIARTLEAFIQVYNLSHATTPGL